MSKADKRLDSIEEKITLIAQTLEKSGFYEYILYVNDRSQLLKRNFFSGLMRGLGAAIGFSLLGAIVILLLQRLANSSIPYIADFITRIMEIIQNSQSCLM